MSDDKLLGALGREAARQEQDEERWRTLGASSDRAASAGSADGDSQTAKADGELVRTLFAPPTDAFVDQMTDGVLKSLAAGGARRAQIAPSAPAWRRRSVRWAGLAFAPIAAAAAIALFVSRPGTSLPAYTLTVSGGLRESRGAETRAPSEPLSVAPGSQVTLLARPEARASESVHAATFLLRSGVTVPVPSASEVSEKGALRVTVLGDDLARAAGGAADGLDLVLVVGLSSELAAHAAAPGSGDRATSNDWVRFSVPVRMQTPGR